MFSVSSFKKLFSFGSKLLLSNLINTVYANLYPLIIGKRFSPAETGQFSRAGQFPNLCSTTIGSVLNRVAFPILSRIQDDDERLLHVYKKYIQFSSFIIFPAILGLCGCARPLISLLLTDKWIECVPLMQILCFAYLFDGIILINLNLLYVKGRSDLVLKLEIIKKSIAFAILFFTAFFSIKIMCYGRVLYALIALYLNTYYTTKILHYSLWDQLKTFAPYLLLSLIVLAEAFAVSALIRDNLGALLISLAICPLTYYFLANKLNLYALSETSNYIKAKINIHFKK